MLFKNVEKITRIINTTMNREPPDLIVKNGNLVNVYTGEIYEADIVVKDDVIVKVVERGKANYTVGPNTEVVDVKGKFIVPGFIDGHIHIESSMLSIPRFAEAVLPLGTTSVITDLHEIGIVLGLKGIRYMLDVARKTPLKVFLMIPSHIPFMPGLETVGSEFTIDDIKTALEWEESVALSEVVFAQLLGLHRELLESIELTLKKRKLVEGHGPALSGNELQAFIAAGTISDHEAVSAEEGLDKLRLGLELMIREGSVATNLSEVIKVVTKYHVDTSKIMLVSDDVSCRDLIKIGHMNYKVKRAIEEGVDPIKAIQMATINVAKHFRIDDFVGSVTPGRYADIVVVDNLRDLNIEMVIANGKLVCKEGSMPIKIKEPEYPEEYLKTLRVKREITVDDLKVKVPISKGKARVRVIGVKEGTLLKDALVEELDVVNGEVISNIGKDVLKVAVIERHKATGNIGLGFVKGFNLKEGAIASTIAHDHHNITVIAANDDDAALAVNTLIDIGGGIIVTRQGKVVCYLELPIAGLLSPKPLAEVSERLEKVYKATYNLGCKLRDPVIHLSFITATAIPAYGISDKGLIDVVNKKAVPIVIEYYEYK